MHEGENLKAFLEKSFPRQLGKLAEDKLNMSRQNLNHHLRKQVLEPDFERLIKEKLNIIKMENGFSITGKSHITPVDEDSFMEVPVLTILAQAGYLRSNADTEYLKGLEKMLVPKEYDKGKYIVVEINGDSMDDGTRRALCEGDKLLIKELDRSHWRNKLHYRKNLFVVCTKEDGVVCKEITDHNVENGTILCHSWNSIYTDYSVNLIDVLQLFYVKKIVERRINL